MLQTTFISQPLLPPITASPSITHFSLGVHGSARVTRSIPSNQASYPVAPTPSPQHYQSNIWSHDFVESLQNHHMEKGCREKIEKLKEDVRAALNDDKTTSSSLEKLELIDALQRLGVGYHFEKEIKRALDTLCNSIKEDTSIREDLHSTALCFRLLRQHGFQISQGAFNAFKDNTCGFKAGLSKDIKGMLSLYEASHLCFEGEDNLSEAKAFTIRHLKLLNRNIDSSLAEQVVHALELPLHWSMPRLDSRWFIDACRKNVNMNPSLLEFAVLNFNMVQANHQTELSHLSRWWRHIGIAKKLSFARDRFVESYFFALGLAFEPEHEYCRKQLTKVINFILTIDDIYDIYGSLEELEAFTVAIDRWDTEAMEQLPDYMKICFLAVYDTTKEMANTAEKEQGWDILPYLKKVWADLCTAMLVEAKWSKKGYTPSLQEYLSNAWVSSSTPVVLVHAFFATNQKSTNEVLECLKNNSDLIYYSSLIFRLCNDLATSSAELKRGDVPSAIECYMRETNVSELVAREKITGLVSGLWKKLNKSIADSPFSLSFVNIAMNHVRAGHSVYQNGDGISVQDHEAKERIMALLVKSIVY